MILLKTALIITITIIASARNTQNIPSLNSDLQQKINRYQTDVKALQQQVQNVKQQLEKAKTQPSLGFASVQEGIANQRDLLRTIQSYLTLPFNISSCDCYQLNQGQRERVLKQISSIKQGLEKLQNADGLDQSCKQYSDIRKQITRQKQYIDKVEASLLNSQCALKLQKKEVKVREEVPSGIANIAQSEYQTNLKAQNLCYGKLNQQQIKLLWFAFSVKNNVINCPLETPFYDGKSCIACQGDTPFFDLSLKRCIAAKGVDKNKQCIDPSFTQSNDDNNEGNKNSQTETTYKEIPVTPLIDKPIVNSITLHKENKTNEKTVAPIEGKAILTKQKSTTKIGYQEVQPVEAQPLIRLKKTRYTTDYERVAPLESEPLSRVVRSRSSRWSSSRSRSSVTGSSSSSSDNSSGNNAQAQGQH